MPDKSKRKNMTVRPLLKYRRNSRGFAELFSGRKQNFSGIETGIFARLLFRQSVSSFFHAVSRHHSLAWVRLFFPSLQKFFQKNRQQAIWQSDSCRLTRRIKKSPRFHHGSSDFHKFIISCQGGDIKCLLCENHAKHVATHQLFPPVPLHTEMLNTWTVKTHFHFNMGMYKKRLIC